MKHYHEIYKLYKEIELTRNIRLRKFQWMGHVKRIKDEIAKLRKTITIFVMSVRLSIRPLVYME